MKHIIWIGRLLLILFVAEIIYFFSLDRALNRNEMMISFISFAVLIIFGGLFLDGPSDGT